MNRKIIKPRDKAHWLDERSQDVTSTEIAALFGMSPYATEFEVWHRHSKNEILELEPNERMTWGTRLQDAIAKGIIEDMGTQGRPMQEYIRIPDLKMGASFDWRIQRGPLGPDENDSDKDALLEIKNVDALQFREKWDVDGDNIEAPMHIEMQLQYQMMIAGVAEAYIGALIGGNQVKLIKREIDNDIAKSIQEKVFEFWESIRKGHPPAPDFRRDADFISKLYRSVKAGTVIESTTDDRLHILAEQYRDAQLAEKEAGERKAAAKAELLTFIGEAEKVKGEGFSISASMTAPTRVEAYDRAGFRNFRVTFKKTKE